jgi:hypothetical protein
VTSFRRPDTIHGSGGPYQRREEKRSAAGGFLGGEARSHARPRRFLSRQVPADFFLAISRGTLVGRGRLPETSPALSKSYYSIVKERFGVR